MNWKVKAAIYKAISVLPFDNFIQFQLQKYISKSLPRTLKGEYLDFLQFHVHNLLKNSSAKFEEIRVFEFGAGWDLFYNVGLWCYGIENQTVVDLSPKVKLSLVENELNRFSSIALPGAVRRPESRRPLLRDVQDFEKYGIHYSAPFDARTTGFQSNSFDAIVSTNTFEDIPPRDLDLILIECYRILRPSGVISARIDYVDHFHYSDSSIGPFNFLNYSENEWSVYNSNSFFQNRLRHRDYLEMFDNAGFEIVNVEELDVYPSCDMPNLNKRYSKQSRRDLTVSGGLFCLRKPGY